jgi:hypothetical protein
MLGTCHLLMISQRIGEMLVQAVVCHTLLTVVKNERAFLEKHLKTMS